MNGLAIRVLWLSGILRSAGSVVSRTGALARALLTTVAVCVLSASASASERVVVLTSYPEELTARFQAAFERRYPGTRVEILWRQSADALAWLRSGGSQSGQVDVYWAPSPGNFARLRDDGYFTPLDIDRDALPGDIGGFPISDPDGYFAAFELAGYGIAYNTQAIARLGLAPPADWADLAAAAYAGQVELPIPGRVGFAPVLIDAVLQAYGWERGWALLAEIAANAGFEAGAGPGVDAVARGDKAARMTIDFFAASAIADGAPVGFVYPAKTAYNPAHIAIFAGATNRQTARKFVEFALSQEGQQLLLHPDVGRLPVLPELYARHPELSARPFDPGNLAYDGELTQARRGLVAALFEIALVQPHAVQAPLWQALHAAEQADRDNEAVIREARALLTAIPVDERLQADPQLRQLFVAPDRAPGQPVPAPSTERVELEAYWADIVAQRIEAARALLEPVRQ